MVRAEDTWCPWLPAPVAEEVPPAGEGLSDVSTNEPRDTTCKPFQSHSPSSAAHKRKSFYSVGFKALFTLSPQENFPVDSRRIYELIKLLFKNTFFYSSVSWGCPLLNPSPPHALHLGQGRDQRVAPGGRVTVRGVTTQGQPCFPSSSCSLSPLHPWP